MISLLEAYSPAWALILIPVDGMRSQGFQP
jgi:hypothetical protein